MDNPPRLVSVGMCTPRSHTGRAPAFGQSADSGRRRDGGHSPDPVFRPVAIRVSAQCRRQGGKPPDLGGVHSGYRRDRGSGLFGMLAGFTVFLLLLTTAVQVLFNLYANTLVTGAAVKAARIVAGYDSAGDRCAAAHGAESVFWQSLGNYREQGSATLTWKCADHQTVSLTVTAEHPTILPQRLRALTGLGQLNRVIEVRVEERR